jgi:hypothetical protein
MAYRREMAEAFPELRLCEFDWKAQQIAIDNYANFDQAAAAAAIVKSEPSDPALDSITKKRQINKDHRKGKKKIKRLKEKAESDDVELDTLEDVLMSLSSTTSSADNLPSSPCPPSTNALGLTVTLPGTDSSSEDHSKGKGKEVQFVPTAFKVSSLLVPLFSF